MPPQVFDSIQWFLICDVPNGKSEWGFNNTYVYDLLTDCWFNRYRTQTVVLLYQARDR